MAASAGVVFCWVIVAEMSAAAFLSLDGRARNQLRNGEQVAQIERGVPAAVVFAVSRDGHLSRSFLQRAEFVERLLHLFRPPHNSDQMLHHFLQIVLNL